MNELDSHQLVVEQLIHKMELFSRTSLPSKKLRKTQQSASAFAGTFGSTASPPSGWLQHRCHGHQPRECFNTSLPYGSLSSDYQGW
jgi:hypothetical protein